MPLHFQQSIEQALDLAVRKFTNELDYSIIQNFKAQGRPTPWEKTRRGGAILQQSGRLRASISVRSQKTGTAKYEVTARTNGVAYARIHQFGGTITPKKAKALAIPLSDEAKKKSPRAFGDRLFIYKNDKGNAFLAENKGEGKRAKVVIHYKLQKSVKIPARPFLLVQDEDIELFKENFTSSLVNLV